MCFVPTKTATEKHGKTVCLTTQKGDNHREALLHAATIAQDYLCPVDRQIPSEKKKMQLCALPKGNNRRRALMRLR